MPVLNELQAVSKRVGYELWPKAKPSDRHCSISVVGIATHPKSVIKRVDLFKTAVVRFILVEKSLTDLGAIFFKRQVTDNGNIRILDSLTRE